MDTEPHSSSVCHLNPQGLVTKTVNPLLIVSVAQQGWLHIMLDERWDMGQLYHSNWPHGACALCQPDSKLFYASGALIFHTVSSHDSLFPQRKIAVDQKKKEKRKKRTPSDRLVHCTTEFRLQAEGDEGR